MQLPLQNVFAHRAASAAAIAITGWIGVASAAAQSPMTLTPSPFFATPTATTSLFQAIGTNNNGGNKARLEGGGLTQVLGGNPAVGFWSTERSWEVQWNQAAGTVTFIVYSTNDYTGVPAMQMSGTPPVNPNNTLVGIDFQSSVSTGGSFVLSGVEIDGDGSGPGGFASVPSANYTNSTPGFLQSVYFHKLGGTLGDFTLRGKAQFPTGLVNSDAHRFVISGRQSLMRSLGHDQGVSPAPVTTLLPGGASPIDLAVADVDGDTDTDFVALAQTSTQNVLSVGLNSAGAFAAVDVTNVAFGNASGRPEAIVAGNFDGSPGIDFAVLTSSIPPVTTENKVYIFSNNGSGAFSLSSTVTLTGMSMPSDIAVGNFNGGNDDLVVTDAGSGSLIPGTAKVLLNLGGAPVAFAQSSVGSGYTRACRAATVALVDGDSNADVVIVESNTSTGSMHVLLGDGLGNFSAMASSPFATSANGQDVTAVDLEADGDADLVVCCTTDALSLVNGKINVFVNNGGGGLARSDFNSRRGPVAIAGGRLEDANATPAIGRDLAVANLAGGSVTVLGDYRNGGFTQGAIVRNVTPTAVAIADINNDNYGDLVYADATALSVGVITVSRDARVDAYGTGAAGTGGLTPVLSSLGNQTDATQQWDPRPMLAAPGTVRASTFGMRMSDCRTVSPALVVISDGIASPLTAGQPLVGALLASWFEVSDLSGNMYVSLPIPNDPLLKGLYLYAQGAVFDPAATTSFFPGLSLSQGLRLRIGDA